MSKTFQNVVLVIDGEAQAARVRTRERRANAKARDMARCEAREFKRDRAYA